MRNGRRGQKLPGPARDGFRLRRKWETPRSERRKLAVSYVLAELGFEQQLSGALGQQPRLHVASIERACQRFELPPNVAELNARRVRQLGLGPLPGLQRVQQPR